MSRPASGRVTPFLATSLLCNRVPGGLVDVNKESDALSSLFDQNPQDLEGQTTEVRRTPATRRVRPKSTPARSLRSYAGTSRPVTASDVSSGLRLQQWVNDRLVNELQERSDTGARETKDMYNQVLETEATFVRDVSSFVDYSDLIKRRRKEQLHKEWTNRVYAPVRRSLNKEMESQEFHKVVQARAQLYKEYLEHVNRKTDVSQQLHHKDHAFLDTFSPEDYYPLALTGHRPNPLKCHYPRLRDPTTQQLQAAVDEERIIHACLLGTRYTARDCEMARLPLPPLTPLGRHGCDSRKWLELSESDIISPVRKASQKRITEDHNECSPPVTRDELGFPRRMKGPRPLSRSDEAASARDTAASPDKSTLEEPSTETDTKDKGVTFSPV